jgi:hypothetical protein
MNHNSKETIMPKYLLSYHGGSMPESPEEGEKVMAAWNAWMGKVGSAIVDGGNPTGASKTIAADGGVSDGGGANAVTGYTILSADSLDAAVKLAKDCPQLASGGSIEVGELIEM